jgi:Zn-dependent protease with chaperone function
MRGLADAALLAVVAVGSVTAVPVLVRAGWPRRSPAAAILLWQALGLAGGTAAVGTLLMVALPGDGDGVVRALQELPAAIHDSQQPVTALRLLCLTAALALFSLLCWVLAAVTVTVIYARRRQRELLALLAHGDPKVPGALVLDHPAAAAYCVPGLRSKIVVSAGALALLGDAELAAVLAHERAHLRERHDLVLLPFTALRRAFPRSHACTEAYREVAMLVEMLADDRALSDRPARELVSALVRVGTAGQVSVGTLAAMASSDSEVTARVNRLLRPRHPLPAPVVAGICLGSALLAVAPMVLLIS